MADELIPDASIHVTPHTCRISKTIENFNISFHHLKETIFFFQKVTDYFKNFNSSGNQETFSWGRGRGGGGWVKWIDGKKNLEFDSSRARISLIPLPSCFLFSTSQQRIFFKHSYSAQFGTIVT